MKSAQFTYRAMLVLAAIALWLDAWCALEATPSSPMEPEAPMRPSPLQGTVAAGSNN